MSDTPRKQARKTLEVALGGALDLCFGARWDPESEAEGIRWREEATREIRYTVRVQGTRFQPRVYAAGKYTVELGRGKPDASTLQRIPCAGHSHLRGVRRSDSERSQTKTGKSIGNHLGAL